MEQIPPKGRYWLFACYKGDITDKLGTNPTKKVGIDFCILQGWYYRQVGNKSHQKGRYWLFAYYNVDISDKLGTNPTKR